jgi:hypothetical protein
VNARRFAVICGSLACLVVPVLASADVGGQGAPPSNRVTGDFANSDLFWFWPRALLLHVNISPPAQTAGSVRTDPLYINCPDACTRPFVNGSTTMLYATPSNGFTFSGWSGAGCAGQGNPCTVTVDMDKIVTANFSGHFIPLPPPMEPTTLYTLTVSVTSYGSGGVASSPAGINCSAPDVCSSQFPAGMTVTLTGFGACSYSYWTGDGTTDINGDRVVVMDGNKAVADLCGLS